MITDVDHVPAFHEVLRAVKRLKCNNTVGPDGIQSKVFQYRGYTICSVTYRVSLHYK